MSREREPTVHRIKCRPEFYAALADGSKTFEVRRDDRNYAVGDTLIIQEWVPVPGAYTGRRLERSVSYKFPGGALGLDPDFCVLGLCRPSSSEAGEVGRLVDAACRALEDWAHDLADTRDAYIDAMSTWRMNGHRIKKEAAKQYAHDFGERSSAVEGCVNIVRTAITRSAATIERLSAPVHASDCAVHNEPAMPSGPCDCGVDIGETVRLGFLEAAEYMKNSPAFMADFPAVEAATRALATGTPVRLSAPVGGVDPEVIQAARRWVSAHEQHDLTESGGVTMKFARALLLSRGEGTDQ